MKELTSITTSVSPEMDSDRKKNVLEQTIGV
jgi:hypothetical protein